MLKSSVGFKRGISQNLSVYSNYSDGRTGIIWSNPDKLLDEDLSYSIVPVTH